MPWPAPPAWPPSLGSGDVHVWRADLRRPAADAARLTALLAPDERRRAAAFRCDTARGRFVAARAILRRLLAGYLGACASGIELAAGPHGKPALAGGDARLRFNVAHSGDLALVALARDHEVGVDVELVPPDFEWQPVARITLSAAEQLALLAHAPAERPALFFRAWTRKEAYLKARGTGLDAPLPAVSVPLGDAGGEVHDAAGGPAAGRWTLVPLDPGPGCVAALALPPGPNAIACWEWRDPGPPAGGGPAAGGAAHAGGGPRWIEPPGDEPAWLREVSAGGG